MTVTLFPKSNDKTIELDYDDEIAVREWAVEQAMIILGYDGVRTSGTAGPEEIIDQAQKFYNYIVNRKVTSLQ